MHGNLFTSLKANFIFQLVIVNNCMKFNSRDLSLVSRPPLAFRAMTTRSRTCYANKAAASFRIKILNFLLTAVKHQVIPQLAELNNKGMKESAIKLIADAVIFISDDNCF